MKVLIIGGVAGGASAAARLRRLDENIEIIMFERGEYISFANCGLPYYIGGEITNKAMLTLQTPESFNARFNVDVRVFNEVTAIDKDTHTVTVKNHKTGETYMERYDKLILSMGAEPLRPNIEGINSEKVFTLRNIPDTYKIKNYIHHTQPRSAAVVGGGYIGVEMAENLKQAGLQVTIIEMANQVIAPLDYDMASDVHRHIENQGVNLILGNAVRSVTENENGLHIALNSGTIDAEMLIMSIGIRPETAIAKNAGIPVNKNGFIITNESMLTNDPDIYAVGDAVEVTDFVTKQKVTVPLAGPANKQGRIAADNICGVKSKYTGTQGSAILKVFDMTVATTGINEKTAQKLKLDYDKSFTYSASHASYYPGAVNMSIKTIFEKGTGKILGAQLVGFEGTDKRCDVMATAIHFGATANDLTNLELCYAPPYSSAKDPVNMAGYVIENLLTGKFKQIHWHDVKNLPHDGSVTLLDVRNKIEYENNHMDGFINIPLNELRNRLPELDKSKPVYATCQMGLRGYVACRMLSQHGFQAYNLSGGTRLYNSIYGVKATLPSTIGINSETQLLEKAPAEQSPISSPNITISVDACGLQCPGPIVKLAETLKEAKEGDLIEISTTDPAFAADIEGFCRRTGNIFKGMTQSKGVAKALLQKGVAIVPSEAGSKKTIKTS